MAMAELLQSRLNTQATVRPVMERTIELCRTMPNLGRLLNNFIDHLDNMPDELDDGDKENNGDSGVPSKKRKTDKEKKSDSKLSDKNYKKLLSKNKKLPDLIMVYTELYSEMKRF